MAMWAARRSPAAGCAFSRRIARCISGYGVSVRYTAAQNAAAVAPLDDADEKEVKLVRLLREVRNKRLGIDEALKSYNGEINPSILAAALRCHYSCAYPVYMWAKSKAVFAYTPATVAHLITALRHTKRLDQAQEVISEITGDCEVEAIARSKLFEEYIKDNDVENAFKAKAELEERGLKLLPFGVSRLIMFTYEKEGADAMLAVYNEYLAKGLQPEGRCFSFMVIVLCTKDNRIDDAFRIFKDSFKNNVNLNEQHFVMLISKLLNADRVKDAQEVAVGLMKFYSVIKSDGSIIKQLLEKLIQRKSYKNTVRLLKLVLHQKKYCSELEARKLLRALVIHKKWDKAMELVELMKEEDIKKDVGYSLLITKLCEEKRLGDAKKAFDMMIGAGLAPDAAACAALATCSASQ